MSVGESFENPFESVQQHSTTVVTPLETVSTTQHTQQMQMHTIRNNVTDDNNNSGGGIRKRGARFLKTQLEKIYRPRSVIAELDRELHMKRHWHTFKTIFLIVGLLMLAYAVYTFDVRVSLAKMIARQTAEEQDALRRATLSSWYDNISDRQLDLITMPRYTNELDYITRANMCRTDVLFVEHILPPNERNADWSDASKPPLDSIHTYYHFDDNNNNVGGARSRSKTFVSLNVIRQVFDRALKSSSSIRDSDLLCTYMFGGWPQELRDIPCLCVLLDTSLKEKVARNIINPLVTFRSTESVEIVEEDLLFYHVAGNNNSGGGAAITAGSSAKQQNSNDISSTIPTLVGVHFETFVSNAMASTVAIKQHKVFDLISGSERYLIPVVPQRREQILAMPQQVNVFVWMERLTKMFEKASAL